MRRFAWLVAVALIPFAPARTVQAAQGVRDVNVRVAAQGILVGTYVHPGIDGRSLAEGYLTQPAIMADASLAGGRLIAQATLNLEGITLERGELSPGGYGEGYVDRRHPHSYLHELVVGFAGALGRTRVSLVAGRAFAPFGTDDPMMRPFVKYPVNHHLAQILERYVVIAAIRRSGVTLEGALFNGDEPVGAGVPSKADRFGDSWSGRATVHVPRGVRSFELSGSYASVASPEHRDAFGFDNRKWSASARFERAPEPAGRPRIAPGYALVEWALTDELHGRERAYRFTSFLAEGTLGTGPLNVSARYEQTSRPEEERLLNAFRTPRPPADLSILGVTRWRIGTVGLSLPIRRRSFGASPFVETALLLPKATVTSSAFVPEDFYGGNTLWMFSLGVRLEVGAMRHRMGRYGAALPAEGGHSPHRPTAHPH